MSKTTGVLLNEVRYAQRLTERTARLYRRAQSVTTFLSLVGGSAAIAAIGHALPGWVGVLGLAVLAVVQSAAAVVRPVDKAVANEHDSKRYGLLLAEAPTMDLSTLEGAIAKARLTDAPEVEPLRDVAYNDVAQEVGRSDVMVPLRLQQKILAALA